VLYRCLSVQFMEYCTGLFVWGLEVCAHLVVGGVCVAEVRGGGLRCWGLCVFMIKSLDHTPLPQSGEHKPPAPTQTDLYNTP